MSNEEQAAALGRALEEHGEAKKRLAALTLQAESESGRFYSWGRFLSTRAAGLGVFRGDSAPPDEIGSLPTQEKIEALIAEITATTARKKQLAALLKEAGYEPKE